MRTWDVDRQEDDEQEDKEGAEVEPRPVVAFQIYSPPYRRYYHPTLGQLGGPSLRFTRKRCQFLIASNRPWHILAAHVVVNSHGLALDNLSVPWSRI